MRQRVPFLFLSLCLLCFASAAAQADCPALVDAAFNTTNELCADLGRNEACYGNLVAECHTARGCGGISASSRRVTACLWPIFNRRN
ncbi:MAG: hypothetical protein U0694_16550 [Anaerolineae bacterium]